MFCRKKVGFEDFIQLFWNFWSDYAGKLVFGLEFEFFEFLSFIALSFFWPEAKKRLKMFFCFKKIAMTSLPY